MFLYLLQIENLLLSSRGQIKLCDFGSATTKSLYPSDSWTSVERSLVEDEVRFESFQLSHFCCVVIVVCGAKMSLILCMYEQCILFIWNTCAHSHRQSHYCVFIKDSSCCCALIQIQVTDVFCCLFNADAAEYDANVQSSWNGWSLQQLSNYSEIWYLGELSFDCLVSHGN